MTALKDTPLILGSDNRIEVIPERRLHRKLAQVMYEAERIPKNGVYDGPGRFRFVQAGDAADVIRKALAEKNVTMIPTSIELLSESEHETAKGTTMTTITVRTTWTLTDGETGETVVIQSMGSGADAGDKASPKAQTNAMKYALLMGFLLSTGDDSELSDSSDRRPKRSGFASEPPSEERTFDEPTMTHAEGLIGVVEKGRAPVDLEPRQTPTGLAFGFKLKAGNRAFQVLAVGPLGKALSMVEGLEGQRVTVYGTIDMIPWRKGDRDMPPYPRVNLERIQTPDYTLPATVELTPEERDLIAGSLPDEAPSGKGWTKADIHNRAGEHPELEPDEAPTEPLFPAEVAS
jgi:hypothetical protein